VPGGMPRGQRHRRGLGMAGAFIALSVVLAQPIPTATADRPTGPPVGRPSSKAAQPNIVLILTDDQRWDTLWAMPNVQSELMAQGVTFDDAFVTNSLCCPSRTTILTGKYSHGTGVYDNAGHYGGFKSFHGDGSTIATWLHGAGYHTGLVGKYLNEYNNLYIPPGWDRWVAFSNALNGGAYENYTLNEDGVPVTYGDTAADYSTDVLASTADSFIRDTPAAQPLFLYFAPFAPHTPSTPADTYMTAFQDLPPFRPPNYNELGVNDKPAWVQALPRLPTSQQRKIDNSRKRQYRTLLSVDDAVDTIVTALTDTGRLQDTLIVFMSDNGWALGEHRWNNKKAPYEEDIRVPMVVRYDAVITAPRHDAHDVLNMDLAPTFADASGVVTPSVDGTSFMPLLTDPQAPWRHQFLVEHHKETSRDQIPSYCEIRDDAIQPEGFDYTVYATGEEELYDLKKDPYQLGNVASSPAYASTLAALRIAAQSTCTPAPPGMTFPYDVLAPTVPGAVAATGTSDTQVSVTWSPSSDNVAVAGYTVYRDGTEVGTAGGPATTFTDTGLAPSTSYAYTVDAFDAAGNHSAASASVVGVTLADTVPPSIPQAVVASPVSVTEIDLSWSSSTDDVGVAGYTITRDGTAVGSVDGVTTSFSDTGLAPGTTYSYTVEAFDAAGNPSGPSATAEATTPDDLEPPTVPTDLQATAISSTEIDLDWTASTDDVAVDGYTVYRDGSEVATVDGLTTSFADTGLTPDTMYTYTVDAFDAAGNHSAPSSPAQATTKHGKQFGSSRRLVTVPGASRRT